MSSATLSVSSRVPVLGMGVDVVTEDKILSHIKAALSSQVPRQIITANALMLLAAQKSSALAEAFRSADLVVPDSAGVVWALRRSGQIVSKIAGIDLMTRLCQEAALHHWTVFFFGAGPGVARQTADRLAQRFPGLRVVGAEDGYFSKEREGEIVARISQAAPDLLFVALATPHQDIWIHNQKTRLGAKIAMGVGGSFDVLSGNLRRSPVWMQRMGAEWLFRLCQEPRRFFRMMGLPLFVWRVMFDSSPLSQKAPSVPSPLR